MVQVKAVANRDSDERTYITARIRPVVVPRNMIAIESETRAAMTVNRLPDVVIVLLIIVISF